MKILKSEPVAHGCTFFFPTVTVKPISSGTPNSGTRLKNTADEQRSDLLLSGLGFWSFYFFKGDRTLCTVTVNNCSSCFETSPVGRVP